MIFIFPALYGEGYLTIQQLLDGRFDSIVKNSLFSSYKDIGWVVVAYTVLTLFGKSFAALFTLNGGGMGEYSVLVWSWAGCSVLPLHTE